MFSVAIHKHFFKLKINETSSLYIMFNTHIVKGFIICFFMTVMPKCAFCSTPELHNPTFIHLSTLVLFYCLLSVCPPSLLYNGCQVFSGGKVWPGCAADHSPPSSAMVLEE